MNGGKMIEINKVTDEQIQKHREARASWGHEKYGDADKFRDGTLDMMEETADVINIMNRRLKWVNEWILEVGNKEVGAQMLLAKQSNNIKEIVKDLNIAIKDFDESLRHLGYPIDDRNGGERIGLEHLQSEKL